MPISLETSFAHITARQDHFSGAFIRSVCAAAGCGCETISLDNDKVDYTVSSRVAGTVRTKPKIDIQAKCQIKGAALTGDTISYPLDIETYDSLRDPLVSTPRILVVVLVPTLIDEWISQSEIEWKLQHCAYWLSLKGLQDSNNATSQTVYLPRANIFSPESLQQMMVKTSNGLDLS